VKLGRVDEKTHVGIAKENKPDSIALGIFTHLKRNGLKLRFHEVYDLGIWRR
jgi:hypothetical protein